MVAKWIRPRLIECQNGKEEQTQTDNKYEKYLPKADTKYYLIPDMDTVMSPNVDMIRPSNCP